MTDRNVKVKSKDIVKSKDEDKVKSKVKTQIDDLLVEEKNTSRIKISKILDQKSKIKLNEIQITTINLLQKFVTQESEKIFYLFGYAGTGKTFLITHFIQEMIRTGGLGHIFICASTHKALNVLKSTFKMLEEHNHLDFDESKSKAPVTFMTLHKLLSFKPVIDFTSGEKIFKSTSESKFLKRAMRQLVIIDECSMIQKSLRREIDRYILQYPFKVIYLGDPAQLPPVNELGSNIFELVPKDYPYHVVLNQIMRSSKDQINGVNTIIREWKMDPYLLRDLKIYDSPEGPFRLFKYHEDYKTAKWFKHFMKLISEGKFPMILTWTNKRTDFYNQVIRSYLHDVDENPNEFVIGDYLIFNDYYHSPLDDSIYYTSDKIIIKAIAREKKPIGKWTEHLIRAPKSKFDERYNQFLIDLDDDFSLKFKVLTLTVERIGGDVVQELRKAEKPYDFIQTIDPSDLDRLNDTINKIQMKITEFSRNFRDENLMNALWNLFYFILVEPFAEVIFGYSVTTHKAQGSTYDIIFADAEDIMKNKNLDEMKKCFYTACSRPSQELYLIV